MWIGDGRSREKVERAHETSWIFIEFLSIEPFVSSLQPHSRLGMKGCLPDRLMIVILFICNVSIMMLLEALENTPDTLANNDTKRLPMSKAHEGLNSGMEMNDLVKVDGTSCIGIASLFFSTNPPLNFRNCHTFTKQKLNEHSIRCKVWVTLLELQNLKESKSEVARHLVWEALFVFPSILNSLWEVFETTDWRLWAMKKPN